MYQRLVLIVVLLVSVAAVPSAQTRPFIPVDGASLKAKFDAAISQGRNKAPSGRFCVGYEFESDPESQLTLK